MLLKYPVLKPLVWQISQNNYLFPDWTQLHLQCFVSLMLPNLGPIPPLIKMRRRVTTRKVLTQFFLNYSKIIASRPCVFTLRTSQPLSVYEMKNNCSLFETFFKIKNAVFLFGIFFGTFWYRLCCCHDNSFAAGPVLIKSEIASFCLNQGLSTPANLMMRGKKIWEPCLLQTGPSVLL